MATLKYNLKQKSLNIKRATTFKLELRVYVKAAVYVGSGYMSSLVLRNRLMMAFEVNNEFNEVRNFRVSKRPVRKRLGEANV